MSGGRGSARLQRYRARRRCERDKFGDRSGFPWILVLVVYRKGIGFNTAWSRCLPSVLPHARWPLPPFLLSLSPSILSYCKSIIPSPKEATESFSPAPVPSYVLNLASLHSNPQRPSLAHWHPLYLSSLWSLARPSRSVQVLLLFSLARYG